MDAETGVGNPQEVEATGNIGHGQQAAGLDITNLARQPEDMDGAGNIYSPLESPISLARDKSGSQVFQGVWRLCQLLTWR